MYKLWWVQFFVWLGSLEGNTGRVSDERERESKRTSLGDRTENTVQKVGSCVGIYDQTDKGFKIYVTQYINKKTQTEETELY